MSLHVVLLLRASQSRASPLQAHKKGHCPSTRQSQPTNLRIERLQQTRDGSEPLRPVQHRQIASTHAASASHLIGNTSRAHRSPGKLEGLAVREASAQQFYSQTLRFVEGNCYRHQLKPRCRQCKELTFCTRTTMYKQQHVIVCQKYHIDLKNNIYSRKRLRIFLTSGRTRQRAERPVRKHARAKFGLYRKG